MDNEFKIMVTGHRPQHLFGFDMSDVRYDGIKKFFDATIASARRTRDNVVGISGMAQGADILWAQACERNGVPFLAFIPFPAQPKMWKEAGQKEWRRLKDVAVGIHYTSINNPKNTYEASRYLNQRNLDMIEECDLVVAIMRADKSFGGTTNAVSEARARGKRIFIFDPMTGKFEDVQGRAK